MKRKLTALALQENKCLIIGPKILLFVWGEDSGGGGKCQWSVFLFKWTQITVAVMEAYFIFLFSTISIRHWNDSLHTAEHITEK